ncbi:piggyBac transposable element-derived protein 3-like [Homalodisca vitripennis]|uniref:piggyBac transposable element-derived protein 3-like n=1 Tax=Homalodisca vitripennis TaxID=197043 RepID=UPI001EEA8857|nr:piggyBac transposable element-derived protein 3-like [Homalodisca vitripennis]
MIRFKGRSTLKQYMPLKPIKRGYKVWVRADESGYIFVSSKYIQAKLQEVKQSLLGERVVKDLTEKLSGSNHKVFFDNFFSSVNLLKDLQAKQIQACGTIRKDRVNLPHDLADDRYMVRGASDWRSTVPGIVVVKWMDQKPVYFKLPRSNR